MKKLLLITNKVMHYRVSVYNYFYHRFKELGWELIVISNELQKQNMHPLAFKFKKIPIAFWTKGLNLDKPNSRISYMMYRYMHRIFDGLILYSANEKKYISAKHQHKIFVANNTINFVDFPQISEENEQKEYNLSW